jgi:uncharacterized membrane protein
MTDTPHDSPDRWITEAAAAADARGRLRTRFASVLSVFVLVWVLAEGLSIWDRLPDRIPTHFGLRGEPDGWGAKSIFNVLGLPLIGAATLALTYLVASLRISVRYWNLPRKDLILRLPRPQQEHVIAPIREAVVWVGAAISIGFSLLARDAWAVALERRDTISVIAIFLMLAVSIGATIVGTIYTQRRVREIENAP